MSVYTPVTEDLLDQIVQRIKSALEPEAIILFGSYATRQPRSDSDIDLLIVTDALAGHSVFERHRVVSDLFPDRRFGLDVLVRTPAEVKEMVEQGSLFFRQLLAQGKVLYGRSPREE